MVDESKSTHWLYLAETCQQKQPKIFPAESRLQKQIAITETDFL